MSGRPNLDGIRSLRQSLRAFAWTRERIGESQLLISEQQKTLELREVELRGLKALIDAKLKEMDVSSPGNAGWEQRHLEMLLMMAQEG